MKISLAQLENLVQDLKCQINGLESRIGETGEWISAAEKTGMRHERALQYLLERVADLTGRCEYLQNRLRRNNLRIYQVPEDCEGEKNRRICYGSAHHGSTATSGHRYKDRKGTQGPCSQTKIPRHTSLMDNSEIPGLWC